MGMELSELAAIPDAARALALARFEQLRPHLEEGRALLDLCRETGLAYRTARRWRDLYRAEGLAGLGRRPRSDRRRWRSLAVDLVRLAEGLALQRPPLGKQEIHRRVAEVG
ncbi:MAG: helix-turn-helix domain-containing protein [Sphingomonas sp.]|nr:helix-turn-helix domain-containing protein [Sphingomonas sp.]